MTEQDLAKVRQLVEEVKRNTKKNNRFYVGRAMACDEILEKLESVEVVATPKLLVFKEE